MKASPRAFSESSSLLLRGKAFLQSSSILGSRPADIGTVTPLDQEEVGGGGGRTVPAVRAGGEIALDVMS